MRFELGLVVLCDLFVGRFRGQSGYSSGSKFPTLRCSKRVQASFVPYTTISLQKSVEILTKILLFSIRLIVSSSFPFPAQNSASRSQYRYSSP